MAGGFYGDWRRYVPMAARRRQGARALAALRRAGREAAPVEIAGRRIATTFWGEAWCRNLEAYSDYANRLPRGRTYVRNGSVIDLQIEPGRVRSLVSGSEIYQTQIGIAPLPKARWRSLRSRCAGHIDSLVELLRGSLSRSVMQIVTEPRRGLFPAPKEISLACSCPDWAELCKHLAATLYGVGARLDREPALLFTLRGVDASELVDAAVVEGGAAAGPGRRRRRLPGAEADLSAVFGIDLEGEARDAAGTGGRRNTTRRRKKAKATGTGTTRKKKKTTRKKTRTTTRKKPKANESTARKKGTRAKKRPARRR